MPLKLKPNLAALKRAKAGMAKAKPRRVSVKDERAGRSEARNLTPPQTWDESSHRTLSIRKGENVHLDGLPWYGDKGQIQAPSPRPKTQLTLDKERLIRQCNAQQYAVHFWQTIAQAALETE